MDFIGQPELIEPITLEVEAIDKAGTQFSTGVSGRREIINHVQRKTFQIQAQVVFSNVEQKMHSTQLGIDEEQKGYVIIRPKDLEDLGETIKRGDRITKFIDRQGRERSAESPLYFTHSVGDLSAHTSQLGFNFIRLFFIDRNPVG